MNVKLKIIITNNITLKEREVKGINYNETLLDGINSLKENEELNVVIFDKGGEKLDSYFITKN